MSDFKFKPGTYLTRDGRKAVVLCDDAPGNTPLKGYIVSERGNESAGNGWTTNGHMWPGGGSSSSDLLPPVPEQQEVVRWVTLWKDDDITITEQPPVSGQRHFLAEARTRVVLTPGRFDTEDSPSEYDRGWNEAIDAATDVVLMTISNGPAERKVRALRRPSNV